MQLLPVAAGFDRHIAVFQIDLDDGIHTRHVDQYAVGCRREIAAGVAHASATGHNRRVPLQTCPDQRLHFIDGAWLDDCADGWTNAEDILRVQRDLLGIGVDDLGG